MKEITLQNITAQFNSQITNKTTEEKSGGSFSELLKSSIKEVDKLQKEADKAVMELAAGDNKNIHQTMIALEKADVSFQLMMQVRNRIIAAYDEIRRMQV